MPVTTRSQARKQQERQARKQQKQQEQERQACEQQQQITRLSISVKQQREENEKQIHEMQKRTHEMQKRLNMIKLNQWFIKQTKSNLNNHTHLHTRVDKMTNTIKIYENAMTCLPLLVEFDKYTWAKFVKAVYDNQYVMRTQINQQPLTIEEWCVQTQLINTLQRLQPIIKSLIINFNLQTIVPEMEIKPDLEYVPCEFPESDTDHTLTN
jgi:hypothetical protein